MLSLCFLVIVLSGCSWVFPDPQSVLSALPRHLLSGIPARNVLRDKGSWVRTDLEVTFCFVAVLLQFAPFGGTSPGRSRPGCQTWMHSSHSPCVCTCATREQAVSWERGEGGGGKCCLPLDILIRWPFYNGSWNCGLYRHATL